MVLGDDYLLRKVLIDKDISHEGKYYIFYLGKVLGDISEGDVGDFSVFQTQLSQLLQP